MKKFLTTFSVIVIILFAFSTFGWVVKHVVQGDKDFGRPVHKSVEAFVGFLDLFQESVKEVKKLPGTFVQTPDDFSAVNKLDTNIFALISYSNPEKGRTVEIRNLKNDSVAHSWDIENPHQEHDRIMDPLLLPGKRLVYSFNGVTGLSAIDSNGNLLWEQTKIPHHHAQNLDSDGNIWLCSYTRENDNFIIYKGRFFVDSRPLNYIDNTVTKLDSETGEILFHKSVSEILFENELSNLLIKSDKADDPLHLNDVQPALKTTPYYQEGDLFLSFRNLSSIIQYRPSENKVVRLIEGLFYSQHDVDFLNDSTIYFFNNNAHTLWADHATGLKVADSIIEMDNFVSNVIAYDLKNEDFFYLAKDAFEEHDIATFTEGMSEMIGDSLLFIEEQNDGILWVLNGEEVVYKNVFPSHHEGYHHLSNWTRILHNFEP